MKKTKEFEFPEFFEYNSLSSISLSFDLETSLNTLFVYPTLKINRGTILLTSPGRHWSSCRFQLVRKVTAQIIGVVHPPDQMMPNKYLPIRELVDLYAEPLFSADQATPATFQTEQNNGQIINDQQKFV